MLRVVTETETQKRSSPRIRFVRVLFPTPLGPDTTKSFPLLREFLINKNSCRKISSWRLPTPPILRDGEI
jgi:hypothetical protein